MAVSVSGAQRLPGARFAATSCAPGVWGEIAGSACYRHGGGDHAQSVSRSDVPDGVHQPLGIPSISRPATRGACRRLGGWLLLFLLWVGSAARRVAESSAAPSIRARDRILTGSRRWDHVGVDRPEFFYPGASYQHSGSAGIRALAPTCMVPGPLSGVVGRSGPGHARASSPRAGSTGRRDSFGVDDLHAKLSTAIAHCWWKEWPLP